VVLPIRRSPSSVGNSRSSTSGGARDDDHVRDPSAPLIGLARGFRTARPVRRQRASSRRSAASPLNVDRLIDGLVRHPHLRLVGVLQAQLRCDLLGLSRFQAWLEPAREQSVAVSWPASDAMPRGRAALSQAGTVVPRCDRCVPCLFLSRLLVRTAAACCGAAHADGRRRSVQGASDRTNRLPPSTPAKISSRLHRNSDTRLFAGIGWNSRRSFVVTSALRNGSDLRPPRALEVDNRFRINRRHATPRLAVFRWMIVMQRSLDQGCKKRPLTAVVS